MNDVEIEEWNDRVRLTHDDRVRLNLDRLMSVPPPSQPVKAEDFRDDPGGSDEH